MGQLWPWLLGLLLMFGVAVLPAALFTDGFVRGVVIGVALASGVWTCVLLVVQLAGSLPTRMGSEVERWTDAELRGLGPSWRVASNVKLGTGRGDIDHVAIGPQGCFVIETKWSSDRWKVRYGPEQRVFRAAEQANRNAKAIKASMTGLPRDRLTLLVPAGLARRGCPDAEEVSAGVQA